MMERFKFVGAVILAAFIALFYLCSVAMVFIAAGNYDGIRAWILLLTAIAWGISFPIVVRFWLGDLEWKRGLD